MRLLPTFGLAAALLLADGGVRPRGSARDYPAYGTDGSLTVAAAVVPHDQVKKLFTADLNGGYIVIEVAVYPDPGTETNVHGSDFLLQPGARTSTIRAADSRAVAAALIRQVATAPPRSSDVTVTQTAEVGRESGEYDPVTGRRRSAVYTGTGVAVSVGGAGSPPYPPPAAIDQARAAVQQELEDKALPEGKTSAAVAGYLYFPKPSGKLKNEPAELTYYGAARQIKLRLPLK